MATSEVVITAFLAVTLVASILSRRIRTPYTILLVLIGILLATTATSDAAIAALGDQFQKLTAEGLFVGLILPPLLFESMMSIKTGEFREVSKPALALATVGTFVATIVGGLVLWQVTALSISSAFLFAALISPTDVATVLEVFKRTRVPSRLATLIESESIFNDATGIALFSIVLAFIAAGVSRLGILTSIGNFVLILGGGVAVGLFVAWGARQLQKEATDSLSQVVLTLTAVYGSYGFATAVGASGLIAVAVTGLFYGNTVLFNIESKEVEEATRQFWNILAFFANTVAFLFIGLNTDLNGLAASGEAILLAFAGVLVARFAAVYPLLSVGWISGKGFPWTWKNVAMIGGMRGAVSIALVSSLPADMPDRDLLVNMTFGVAILSILLQGPLLTSYVRKVFGRQQTLAEAAADTSQGRSDSI